MPSVANGWCGFAAAALVLATLPAQASPSPSPTPSDTASRLTFSLHAAFGPAAVRGALPALVWLCEELLPSRDEWPAALEPQHAYEIAWSEQGLQVRRTAILLGADVTAAGACQFGDGPSLRFQCRSDGTEDWIVPADFAMPMSVRERLRALDADELDQPRTLALSVLAGHLAGGLAEGDPRAELVRLGSSLCGDVTWRATRTADGGLHVRGRSDGGLSLPALLLLLADDRHHRADPLALRAFAARDHERTEAARQLGVATDQDTATLRALLHADDPTRLAAIDALVRRGAAEELPNVVAAADEGMPMASLAAADAVRALWLQASPVTRQRTRQALRQCQVLPLRAIDLDALPRDVPPPPPAPVDATADRRVAALVWLAVFAIGLLVAWLRERHRQSPRAGHVPA